jgi:protein SCO1/2
MIHSMMTNAMRRATWLALAALPAIVFAHGASAADKSDKVVFPQGADQPLAALQDIDVVEHVGDRVPSGLAFRDTAGHQVSFDDLLHQGRPLLVTLGYHRCPMLCGLVLDGLAKAVKTGGLTLGRDYTAVSISIDPDEDAKLAADQQKRILATVGSAGAPAHAEDWPFLITSSSLGGDPEAARAMARAVGFRYKYDEQSRLFAHAAVAFVLTPDGVISRYLYGVDFLARDVKLSLVEASGGRVGTSFDKVLLSCYRYDPINRKYGPYVFAFVRIGAGMVFLALAGLLTILWRKELAMKRQRARIARTTDLKPQEVAR